MLRWMLLLMWSLGIALGHEFMGSSPTYAYEDWGFAGPDVLAVALNVLLCLLLATTLESRLRRPSDYLMWSFVMFVVLPASVFAATYVRVDPVARVTAAGMVILGYLTMFWVLRVLPSRWRIPSPVKSDRLFARALAVVGIVTLIVLLLQLRPSSSISLSSIYERRAELAASGTLPGTGYLVVWAGYVFAPILLLLGLRNRSVAQVAIGIALPLAVFALAGTKLAVILVGFLGLIVLSQRLSIRDGWKNVPVFPVLLLLLNASLLALARLGIDDLAFYYVTRRSVLLPGQITMHYGAWASANPELGILDPLSSFTGTAGPSVAYGVGALYSGEGVNANSSMFSYAFVSGGALAVVLTALVAGALFRFTDILTLTRPEVLIVPFAVVTLNVLTESFLHTAILTGGVGLALALAWLMPEEELRTTEHPSGVPRSSGAAQAPRA